MPSKLNETKQNKTSPLSLPSSLLTPDLEHILFSDPQDPFHSVFNSRAVRFSAMRVSMCSVHFLIWSLSVPWIAFPYPEKEAAFVSAAEAMTSSSMELLENKKDLSFPSKTYPQCLGWWLAPNKSSINI